MPEKQDELNDYVKQNYEEVYAWRGKPYYSIESDDYSGADDVIEDIKRVQTAFPGIDFEVHGSVKFASSGEYCDYKYYVSKEDIRFVQTPVYSIIEDFSDYETVDDLLDAYPWLNFDSEVLQQWIDKKVDEVYYWGDVLSETPP